MADEKRRVPDELTRTTLAALLQSDPVLRASFNTRFSDGLQSLLFRPGFEHAVLAVANRIVDIVVKAGKGSAATWPAANWCMSPSDSSAAKTRCGSRR